MYKDCHLESISLVRGWSSLLQAVARPNWRGNERQGPFCLRHNDSEGTEANEGNEAILNAMIAFVSFVCFCSIAFPPKGGTPNSGGVPALTGPSQAANSLSMSELIFPRSPRETMDGWMHLPRFVDKIRLHLADKLHPDYQPNFCKG